VSNLIQASRRLLRRFGWVVVRARHPGVRYLDHPPATAFEEILLRTFPQLHGLGFIQIGANDGRHTDPLRPFIDEYEWHGLMFEPLRANFVRLQQNRGSTPRLQLRQAAIDVASGRRPMYDLAPHLSAQLPDWTRGLGSFSRDRVAQAVRELDLPESAIVVEEVETVTWDTVWQQFGSAPCDLLVLDTEGYDITLLRAAQLAARRPRLILFEHACNSREEQLAFYRELMELGYELATFAGDTVAYRPMTG
jgi:FkbM family methyltransferase